MWSVSFYLEEGLVCVAIYKKITHPYTKVLLARLHVIAFTMWEHLQ